MCTDKTIESNSSVIKKDNNTWNKTIFKREVRQRKFVKLSLFRRLLLHFSGRRKCNLWLGFISLWKCDLERLSRLGERELANGLFSRPVYKIDEDKLFLSLFFGYVQLLQKGIVECLRSRFDSRIPAQILCKWCKQLRVKHDQLQTV